MVARRSATIPEGHFVLLQMRLRLLITGAAVLGMWVGGIVDEHRVLLTVVIAGGYWLPVLALGRVRARRDGRLLQDLTVAMDLSGGLLGGVLVPDLRAAISLLFLVMVATETVATGRRRGLVIAGLATATAVLLEVTAPVSTPASRATVVTLAGAAVTVPLVIAYLSDRHRQLAIRLGRSSEERIAFVAAVTHDLRTPLTTIKGFVDTVLLQGDRLDGEAREHMLRIAARNADNLSRRIDTLLQFTKMEADRLVVEPMELDLRRAIAAVVEDCAGLLEEHAVEVHVEAATVLADPSALAHILGNLLGNAAKYSAPGDPIVIEAEAAGDRIRITVADHGPGVHEDDVARIFEQFVRGTHRGAGGSGLGLAIAKRYVELSGGEIGVESRSSGAAFWFTLPRVRAGRGSVTAGRRDEGAADPQ